MPPAAAAAAGAARNRPDPDHPDYFTTIAVGAGEGACLRGITAAEARLALGKRKADKSLRAVGNGAARLRIVSGAVLPRATHVAACEAAYENRDRWANLLAAKQRITPPMARLVVDALADRATDNRRLLGCLHERPVAGCEGTARFVIEACAESWTDADIQAAQANRTELSGPELAALFHNAYLNNPAHPGFLTLRHNLWTHAVKAASANAEVARRNVSGPHSGPLRAGDATVDVLAFSDFGELNNPGRMAGSIYDVDVAPGAAVAKRVRIQVADPAPHGLSLEAVQEAVRDVLRDKAYDPQRDTHDAFDEHNAGVDACFEFLARRGIRQAHLKSLLQKILRFCPVRVSNVVAYRTDDNPDGTVNAAVLLLCTVAYGCTKAGDCFNPDIAKYVRGQTAMLKRLAVSIVEDGGPIALVPSLMALAAATAEVEDYNLSPDALRTVLRSLVRSVWVGEDMEHFFLLPDEGVPMWRDRAWYLARFSEAGRPVADLDMHVDEGWNVWASAVRDVQGRPEWWQDWSEWPQSPDLRRAWQSAAALLDLLGAFKGDKAMMHTTANSVFDSEGEQIDEGWAKAHGLNYDQRPTVYCMPIYSQRQVRMRYDLCMPICHFLDHHVTRDLGYALLRMRADSDDAPAGDADNAPAGEVDGVGGSGGGFAARHRQIWEASSGYNPRTHPYVFDEAEPQVAEVRRAQRFAMATLDRQEQVKQRSSIAWTPKRKATKFPIVIDRGAFAAGVGQIDGIKVKTTREQNAADGLSPKEARRWTTWNLVCCLGSDADVVAAMHKPTRRVAGGNNRKPRVTETARRLAEEAVRELARKSGLPFKSSVLPEFRRAFYLDAAVADGVFPGEKAAWVLAPSWVRVSGQLDWGDTVWDYDAPDGFRAEKSVIRVEPPSHWPAKVGRVLRSDVCALDALTYSGPINVVVREAESAARLLIRELTPPQVRRLAGFLRHRYETIALPTPDLHGGMGNDQTDRPLPGDWRVARVLLLISRIVPMALQPLSLTKYKVNDANMLRVVEGWVRETLLCADGPEDAEEQASWWGNTRAALQGTMHAKGYELTDYQTELLKTMVDRDAAPHEHGLPSVDAHFVALDTGMGKTLLGITYLTALLGSTSTAGNRILWFTDCNVVKGHRSEMVDKWGLPSASVQIVRTVAQLRRAATKIAIVPYTVLSSGKRERRDAFVDALVEAAADGVCCFDETHLLYGAGVQRNAAAMRIALAACKFLMMTATPVGSTRQKLATTWLALASPFEVNDANLMVASARMLSARVKMPFECVEELRPVAPDQGVKDRSLAAARRGDWGEAAREARGGVYNALARTAVDLALRDRAGGDLAVAQGGAFLVMDNDREADRIVEYINCDLVGEDDDLDDDGDNHWYAGRQGEADHDTNPRCAVVVGTIKKNVGYNLDRLGVMVTCVYGSNAAARYQIGGRLRRITQKHTLLTFVTVVPTGTVLELLHERQTACDARAASLEQLAEEWAEQEDERRARGDGARAEAPPAPKRPRVAIDESSEEEEEEEEEAAEDEVEDEAEDQEEDEMSDA